MVIRRSPRSPSRRAGSKTGMFYVYLIKNKNRQLYIGYSSDLRRRMKEHRGGKVRTTERLGFSGLVYYEAYLSEEAAKDRENKLKQHGSAFQGLIKRLKVE